MTCRGQLHPNSEERRRVRSKPGLSEGSLEDHVPLLLPRGARHLRRGTVRRTRTQLLPAHGRRRSDVITQSLARRAALAVD